MHYECSHCTTVLFISNAAAWPERCSHCHVWHPVFRSPGFAKVVQPVTSSVIQPGMSVRIPA